MNDYAPWATAPLDAQILAGGFQIEDRYGLRFRDALLIASANAAGCSHFLRPFPLQMESSEADKKGLDSKC